MTRIAPAAEALLFQRDRTSILKPEFLQLPDEARLRAFTIARQTQTAVLQDMFVAIADHLASGGTMGTFREKYPEIVAPYTQAGRDWHLQLVVEQNTKQAQAVGAYQQRQRIKAAFPYVEYKKGVNARPSHAALHKKIFGVDDSYLLSHTPPWDFGCNCDLIPRTAAQVGRVRAEDHGQEVEQQRVVPGNPKLESLAAQNKMPDPARGAIHPVDTRPPVLKGGEYSFRPDRLNQDVDLAAYVPELRDRLSGQLKDLGYTISADGSKAVPPPAVPASPKALKSVHLGKAMRSTVRLIAMKGGRWGALPRQMDSSRIGRGMDRVGKPAPQIARVERRVAWASV